jgi:cytochrome c biogenesis protein ResB
MYSGKIAVPPGGGGIQIIIILFVSTTLCSTQVQTKHIHKLVNQHKTEKHNIYRVMKKKCPC